MCFFHEHLSEEANDVWYPLTHWGFDKMAANFLMTYSNEFSWMKIACKFQLRFHWSLFPMVQ